MSSKGTNLSIKEQHNLIAAILHCMEDDEYKNAFKTDRLRAIDTANLGFTSNDFSQASKDVLTSLTADDIENFKTMYDKFKVHGLEAWLHPL